ncbi:MAG: hypothetical protein ACO3IB_11075, partial [Phycisphaerales bacterium]
FRNATRGGISIAIEDLEIPAEKETLLDEHATISPGDFDIFSITDSVDEAVRIVWESHIGQRVVAPSLPRFERDDEERVSGDGTRGGPRHRRRGGDAWHESAI